MRYALKTQICSTQRQLIRDYGDIVWENICDEFPEPFRIKDVIGNLPAIRVFARRTQENIIRCVLMNVLTDYQIRLIEYDGHVPIKRIGRLYWQV